MADQQKKCNTYSPLVFIPSPPHAAIFLAVMSLLSRLESKLGRFAVPNITVMLIAGQVFVYAIYWIERFQPNRIQVIEKLDLVPALVFQGEWWRLITFLFMPPFMNVIFALIFWSVFYLCGSALEHVWGTFRYNVYLLIGTVATIAVAFLNPHFPTSNFFLKTTVFLAFAHINPNFEFSIYFILPVRAKWLALLTWFYLAYAFATGGGGDRLAVVATVANYLLFFSGDIWREFKQRRRRARFKSLTQQAAKRIVHKCRVCGLTSDDAPQTQFRYCSKCDDGSCYCELHLRNHEHVVKEKSAS